MQFSRRQDLVLAIILALLLYLFYKKITGGTQVTVAIFDPTTGVEIGKRGIGTDSHTIGMIIGGDPNTCPQGYRALIDPSDRNIYCTQIGFGGANS